MRVLKWFRGLRSLYRQWFVVSQSFSLTTIELTIKIAVPTVCSSSIREQYAVNSSTTTEDFITKIDEASRFHESRHFDISTPIKNEQAQLHSRNVLTEFVFIKNVFHFTTFRNSEISFEFSLFIQIK
jgi:hypothetical protein